MIKIDRDGVLEISMTYKRLFKISLAYRASLIFQEQGTKLRNTFDNEKSCEILILMIFNFGNLLTILLSRKEKGSLF